VSAYGSDPRVQIGPYEAWVASPDGPKYIFVAANRDDWVVAPASASTELRSAHDRKDEAAIRAIIDVNPHFGSFDEAIRSLIGEPQ